MLKAAVLLKYLTELYTSGLKEEAVFYYNDDGIHTIIVDECYISDEVSACIDKVTENSFLNHFNVKNKTPFLCIIPMPKEDIAEGRFINVSEEENLKNDKLYLTDLQESSLNSQDFNSITSISIENNFLYEKKQIIYPKKIYINEKTVNIPTKEDLLLNSEFLNELSSYNKGNDYAYAS